MESAPNIVQPKRAAELVDLYWVQPAAGKPAFLREAPKAPSLQELLRSPRSLPWLCGVVQRLCRLLAALHQQDIIHRNLTPASIFVGEGNEIALGGFSLAKLLGEELFESPGSSEGSPFGTPGYIPPEQARGEKSLYDPRIDLFSVGAILYQGLTGRLPFEGKSSLEIILATLEKEPTPLRQLVACPAGLEELCLSLLSKAREARIGSAEEVAQALAPFLEEQASLSLPGTGPTSEQFGSAPTVQQASSGASENPKAIGEGGLPIVAPSVYEVFGELARGGLGKILKAKDKRLNRPVAVKELLRNQGVAKARFLREALLTAKLQHPSIVPIYEAGYWPSGEPFYAMKLVAGQPLFDLIKEKKALEERLSLLPNVIAAGDAMAYAHAEGIIHRDLKPANILVGHYGETIVIDWGLAKDLNASQEPEAEEADPYRLAAEQGELTVAGAVLGTPAYMPPEQAQGKAVDARADVYSLGAILYHVLAGVPPYMGKNSRSVLLEVAEGKLTPIEERAPKAPKDLLAIVKKAMAFSPEERYQSAKEFVEDVKKFQTGQLVEAHQYSFVERARRFVSRNKTPLSFASVSFLIIAGFGAYSLSESFKAQESALRAEQAKANVEREGRALAEKAAKKEAAEKKEREIELARAALDKNPSEAFARAQKITPDNAAQQSALQMIMLDAASRGIPKILGDLSATPTTRALSLSYSSDGRDLIGVYVDGTIQRQDLATKAQKLLGRHDDLLNAGVFSPDKKLLVTTSRDKTTKLWDLTTEQSRLLKGSTGEPYLAAFSPDSRLVLAASSDGVLSLYEAASGALIEAYQTPSDLWQLSFSPDAARFAGASSTGEIYLWEAGKKEPKILAGHQGVATTLSFSPDGNLLASGGNDAKVFVWDVKTKKRRAFERHNNIVNAVVFSPDGKYLASSGDDKSVILWEVAAGAPRSQFFGPKAGPKSLLFSGDGRLLAAPCQDGNVYLWDWSVSAAWILRGHTRGVGALSFSSDGRSLASAGEDPAVLVWDLPEVVGELVFASPSIDPGLLLAAPVASPDLSQIAYATLDHALRLQRRESKEETTLGTFNGLIQAIGFSPSGKKLAASADANQLRIWDLATQQSTSLEDTYQGGSSQGLLFAFSPDERLLASGGGSDNHVRLWDLNTGARRALLEGHSGPVRSLAFSSDGRYLATSGGGAVWVWEVATGKGKALSAPVVGYWALRFSPDGTKLAAGGTFAGVRLWDLATGESQLLEGSNGETFTLGFSSDGRTLTAGSAVGLVFWDLTTKERRTLGGGNDLQLRQASSDGRLLAITDLQYRLLLFPQE